MPLYKIACECGGEEGWASLSQWEAQGKKAKCTDCKEWAPTRIAAVATIGVWDSRPLDIPQVGRSFSSPKELDEYCKREGVEVVSSSDPRWRRQVDAAHESADAARKRQGYSSKEEKARRWKKDKVDKQMAAREREIQAYHDVHGGKPEKNAAENGYGNGKIK